MSGKTNGGRKATAITLKVALLAVAGALAGCMNDSEAERPAAELTSTPSLSFSPSFPCDQVGDGSIEAMICGDEQLSALDRELDGVYAAASKLAQNEQPPMLAAEQRGWISGRNDCWKATDQRECVRTEYERRIAELQARYRLVEFDGPVSFSCDGNPANEVVVTFFHTAPATLIAERGDSVSVMYLQPDENGSRYQGRNESFWEHQGQAVITWGYGAPEMQCQRTQ
ncbi:MliC family protein [Marinobacter zhejiangensis]|uniref:Uncharacterized protein YPO0702 n=1 Tax=Marinobacter zhejiangensis TaxID=488535 RepID=A0A1I4T4H1_9GAMM|nr:MliC family protein [Marinobacter zhejiangensis]SFM71541.1 Uncharacterized protein YPO0702 [Marinobacter zhejiangensis]